MTIVHPTDHDAGWEYLYFASELARGLGEHHAEYEDYQSGSVHPTGESFADPAAGLRELGEESTRSVHNVSVLLSPATLETAFGALGRPADEAKVREVAAGLVEVYAAMMSWGQRVRGASVPSGWESAYVALSEYVALPLRQIQDFSSEVSTTLRRVVGDLRAGRDPKDDVTLALNVSVDPGAVTAFEAALAAARGRSETPSPVRPEKKWWRRTKG